MSKTHPIKRATIDSYSLPMTRFEAASSDDEFELWVDPDSGFGLDSESPSVVVLDSFDSTVIMDRAGADVDELDGEGLDETVLVMGEIVGTLFSSLGETVLVIGEIVGTTTGFFRLSLRSLRRENRSL
eukprot:TRINITY_DN2857_c0_g1_i1.p1 TRINITY_DN2857_c0_g1~~TRINITY_DN2857_c0_g1_i1.p1  ORF type:complete len:128 (+),score=20.47 TRINITY_DN2857_c0_g1_i1:201-584(+)